MKPTINLDSCDVDLNDYSSDRFPLQTVFDAQEGRKPENVLEIVLPEERYLQSSVLKVADGNFTMGENFFLVIVSRSQDDDTIQKIVEGIKSHEQYEKFVIE